MMREHHQPIPLKASDDQGRHVTAVLLPPISEEGSSDDDAAQRRARVADWLNAMAVFRAGGGMPFP